MIIIHCHDYIHNNDDLYLVYNKVFAHIEKRMKETEMQ